MKYFEYGPRQLESGEVGGSFKRTSLRYRSVNYNCKDIYSLCSAKRSFSKWIQAPNDNFLWRGALSWIGTRWFNLYFNSYSTHQKSCQGQTYLFYKAKSFWNIFTYSHLNFYLKHNNVYRRRGRLIRYISIFHLREVILGQLACPLTTLTREY